MHMFVFLLDSGLFVMLANTQGYLNVYNNGYVNITDFWSFSAGCLNFITLIIFLNVIAFKW